MLEKFLKGDLTVRKFLTSIGQARIAKRLRINSSTVRSWIMKDSIPMGRLAEIKIMLQDDIGSVDKLMDLEIKKRNPQSATNCDSDA